MSHQERKVVFQIRHAEKVGRVELDVKRILPSAGIFTWL